CQPRKFATATQLSEHSIDLVIVLIDFFDNQNGVGCIRIARRADGIDDKRQVASKNTTAGHPGAVARACRSGNFNATPEEQLTETLDGVLGFGLAKKQGHGCVSGGYSYPRQRQVDSGDITEPDDPFGMVAECREIKVVEYSCTPISAASAENRFDGSIVEEPLEVAAPFIVGSGQIGVLF